MPITPDEKNWTWVLERPCPECGFDAATIPTSEIATTVRAQAPFWRTVLTREDVHVRPDEDTWSNLEYGCHVRDVLRLFNVRVSSMLHEAEPTFANWDQDKTAIDERYDEQNPLAVIVEIDEAATALGVTYDGVDPTQWGRVGLRSDGSTFSVASIGLYLLHDLLHHRSDVAGDSPSG